MGHASSCLANAVSLAAPDEDALARLARHPALLTKPFNGVGIFLGGIAQTWIHIACERKEVQLVKRMFSFLATSDVATVREALSPYCRRMGLPLPTTAADGVAIAVSCTNAKGQTPLMQASHAGCPELVRFLLAQGADPWVEDRCGCRVALHYAAIAGCAGCVTALLEAPPHLLVRHGSRYINTRSLCGLTPLHYAVFFERDAALRALLLHDPNINAATTADAYDAWADGHARATPMHFAAARGNCTAALELLRHYAAWRHTRPMPDPRLARNAGGRRPWQLAAAHFPASRHLAMLLHPGTPLGAVLGGEEALQASRLGPPSLAELAAAALKDKLLASLQAAASASVAATATAAAAAASSPCRAAQAQREDGRRCGTTGCVAGPPPPPQQQPTTTTTIATSAAASAAGVGDVGGGASGAPPRFRVSAAFHQRSVREEEDEEARLQLVIRQQRQEQQQQLCQHGTGSGSSEVHPFGVDDAADGEVGGPGGQLLCSPPPRPSAERGAGHVRRCGSGHSLCLSHSPSNTSHREARWSCVTLDGGEDEEEEEEDEDGQSDEVVVQTGERSGGFALGGAANAGGRGLDLPARAATGDGAVVAARPAPRAATEAGMVAIPSFREGQPLAGGLRPRCPSAAPRGPDGGGLSQSAPGGGEADGSLAASVRRGNFTDVTGVASFGETEADPRVVPGKRGVSAAAVVCADEREHGVELWDEDEDEDGACGVCFARREAVSPALCHHGLCAVCAGELCRAVVNRPLLCPFCRRPVTGFVSVL